MRVRFFVLFLSIFTVLVLAEPSAQERDFALVKETYSDLDPEVMLRFYAAHAPDMKEEWERRCSETPDSSGKYLLKLATHFLKMEKIREQDWAEYERLLAYEELQGKVRKVSQEVRRLVKQGEEEQTPEHEVSRLTMLEKAKSDLKKLLEEAFDDSLRQQMNEIDRLEAEVKKLRRLARERSMNRMQSLRQRFSALTGQEMPEDTEEKAP